MYEDYHRQLHLKKVERHSILQYKDHLIKSKSTPTHARNKQT